MNTAARTEAIAGASPLFIARLAGVFWLMTALTGTIALLADGPLGSAANLAATACYVAATLFIYEVLKPVDRNLSLLAAVSSLLGCAIGVLASFSLVRAGSTPTLYFGLHCFLVGYLILRSTFLPRFVGGLMALAGMGWLSMGLSRLLALPFARAMSPYLMAIGITGEVTLTLWLLVAGVSVERWKEQAGASVERQSQDAAGR